jgi:hypothetical protein
MLPTFDLASMVISHSMRGYYDRRRLNHCDTGEGLIFQPILFRVLPTHPLGLYSMTTTWSMDILDCIESSNMLQVVLFYLVLKLVKRYLLATVAWVIVPRVIAVGQH